MAQGGTQAWHAALDAWRHLLINARPCIPDLQATAAASAGRMLLHEQACWERVRLTDP